MNQIAFRQNEDDILSALCAQKFLYSKSKLIKFIYYVLMFIVISIGLIFKENETLKLIIAIAIFLLELIKSNLIIVLVDYAAAIQQYIDCKLFEFKIVKNKIDKYTVDDIEQKINEINIENKKYADIQKANNGESKIKGVRDWYTNIDKNLELNDAILKCQKQNTYWDKKLVSVYKKIKIIEALFFLIVLHVLFKNNCVAIIIDFIAFFMNIGFTLKQYIKLEVNINIIKVLEDKISNNVRKKDLEEIQERIFERRKCIFTVPDWLYKISSSKIHRILRGG